MILMKKQTTHSTEQWRRMTKVIEDTVGDNEVRAGIKKNTWAWVYGNECGFLWEHFGMEPTSKDDRMKIKLIDFEPAKEEGDVE